MKYALNAEQMRSIDSETIEKTGIPALVLMERAALKIVEHTKNICTYDNQILVVCGMGNNGGDGIAAARILYQQGYHVDILLIGVQEKATEQTIKQLQIITALGMSPVRKCVFSEYTVIIDALFGIGLSKDITGFYKDIISQINQSRLEKNMKIIAVDIPSGISADNGHVLNCAVKADITVTFGFLKQGLLLYPGAEYTGRIFVEDIGFSKEAIQKVLPAIEIYDASDLCRLPKRSAYSNKGTYGKVLVIAGSKTVTGAACLAGEAAYRSGVGLVKLLTSEEGIRVVRNRLPEALTDCFDSAETIQNSLFWADTILIGPGIGQQAAAKTLLTAAIAHCKLQEKPLILDADAINLLSMELDERKQETLHGRIEYLAGLLPSRVIVTPHLKELSGLINKPIAEICACFVDIARECTYNNEIVFVLKDTRTVVVQKERTYLNLSGNNGMATGGSGDVLCGMIAGYTAAGMSSFEAAALGCYVHGLAGNAASEKRGCYAMLAGDIIEELQTVQKYNSETSRVVCE